MDVSHLRNYGVAFSDAEGSWPPEVKAELRRKGRAIVFESLTLGQRLRFAWRFFRAHRRAKRLDLTDLHLRGMRNQAFLDQQLEYVAFFAALADVVGVTRAEAICCRIMDATAEALLLCLPEADDLRALGDPLTAWRSYARAAPAAAHEAGCQEIVVAEDEGDAIELDVTWCVWLELARRMGVPEACRPNCYADQLVFPGYFDALGIRYRRTQTLACGGTCCDFRFERKPDA